MLSALSTECLSASARDAQRFAEGLDLADDERAAWQYLCHYAEPYPREEFIPPFRAPTGPSRVRGIVGARLDFVPGEREGYPTPAVLWLIGEDIDTRLVLDGSLEDASAVANALFNTATRSKLIVFQHGANSELRLIAQRWGLALDALGYSVDMMVNGGKLRALIVRKGRHRWYLVDWTAVSGRSPIEVGKYLPRSTPKKTLDHNPASRVYLATCYVQWFIRTHFGIGLGVTISSTALRAAARNLSPDVVKWRPLPLMVSMLRTGFGFRGGLISGRKYRGSAAVVDLNRAYTAALAGQLPLRSALGRCVYQTRERPGVFLSRITSAGIRPVYCGRWNAERNSFALGWHGNRRGESFLAVIPSAEFEGIRALGYTIEPGIGLVFTRTFDMRPYVERIARVVAHFGPRSPEGKLTKLLGNAVYGKFAAHPERRTVRLAEKRPGLDWLVWVDSEGYPVENVWEQTRTAYQWSQHVDIAAAVTARVRSWLYTGATVVEAHGAQVLGMQTDCLILDRLPAGALPLHEWRFGAWKVAGEDDDGVVVGPNCYSIGDHTVVPDHPSPQRDDVIALFERIPVDVETHTRGTPRPGAPLSVRRWKRISPPALSPPAT